MTSAATPKGTRRRSRLIEAAGALLLEGGFDAVRHRAVAERAQTPLASTTYYFASLEELMAEAAAHVARCDDERTTARSAGLARRRRGAQATAEALSEVFIGADTPVAELAVRYETIALAARYPRLAEVADRRHARVAALHAEVLDKSGRHADGEPVNWLIAVEEGAVAGALGGTQSPFRAAREALHGVIDVLAPAK
ncbi:MAG: TetR family transcriptional regulator [Gordonia sp. (in: high G+C Gram-positive bacteria)]